MDGEGSCASTFCRLCAGGDESSKSGTGTAGNFRFLPAFVLSFLFSSPSSSSSSSSGKSETFALFFGGSTLTDNSIFTSFSDSFSCSFSFSASECSSCSSLCLDRDRSLRSRVLRRSLRSRSRSSLSRFLRCRCLRSLDDLSLLRSLSRFFFFERLDFDDLERFFLDFRLVSVEPDLSECPSFAVLLAADCWQAATNCSSTNRFESSSFAPNLVNATLMAAVIAL
mmetsp:Transcript_39387/g.62960  ORF Transcript_39387/g.62960 Transcript_39387/m.62960 type:complete len:225 (-) Transcript_39387:2286-2960(-)